MRQSSPVARGKLIIHNNSNYDSNTGVDVYGFNQGVIDTHAELGYSGVAIRHQTTYYFR
jgi:hypothetical protein